MKVLWKNPNVELSDIVNELEDNEWSYSTIKTLLRRLVNKGVVMVKKGDGKNFLYKSVIKEEKCKIKETKNFLSKVFDNSLAMLVSTFAKESNLSKKDQEELMSIINKMGDEE